MRRKCYPILAILFSLLLTVTALAASEGLTNPSLEGTGIPNGWTASVYDGTTGSVSAEDGIVTLSASDYNDLRVLQSVETEENTVYTFSAEISVSGVSGGRGANLSIDNYSLDGSYIYSDGLIGSSDWQRVTLIFRTGEGQKRVNAALRLGGYSEMSRGSARFRNVSFVQGWDGVSPVVSLVGSRSSVPVSQRETELTEMHKIQLKSYLHLFLVASIALGVFLLFGVYRNRVRLGSIAVGEGKRTLWFLLAVLTGLVLRSILASLWGGHDTDMSCWMGWGNYIAQHGPRDFYTAPGHEWYDYPPGYMLVLGFIARILSGFGVSGDADFAVFAYMLPAAAADVAIAAVLMHDARERGFSDAWCLLLGTLVIFNPAAVVLSGAWGQIDSILTLFLLLSFRELLRSRRISAGALYGLAIMIKWQALIYGPVLAVAYLIHLKDKRDILDTILGVLSAVAVMLLISLPFKGNQGLFWFVSRFFNAAGGYDYASVEAYNFLALLGGNWAPAGRSVLGPITYKTIGTLAILASVGAAILLQFRDRKKTGIYSGAGGGRGILFLAAALCMYGIFTFGHYMHERYVFPVIFLLLFAFVETKEEKLLLCSLALSVVLFLNEITAMYVISQLATAVVRSSREHNSVVTACALAETVSFAYFLYVTVDGFFRERKKEVPHA